MQLYFNKKHAHNVRAYIPKKLLVALEIKEHTKFIWQIIDNTRLKLVRYTPGTRSYNPYAKPYKLTTHNYPTYKRYSMTIPIALFKTFTVGVATSQDRLT